MYTTPIHALPAPDQLSPDIGPDVPKDIKGLADAIDGKLTPYSQGAGSPADLAIAPGKTGRRHRNSTNGDIWIDIGAAWVLEIPTAAGDGITVAGRTVSVKRYPGGSLGVLPGGIFVAIDDATIGRGGGADAALIVKDGGITAAKLAAALKPSTGAAAATEALRALGIVAGTAAAGNDARIVNAIQAGDARLTNPRAPNGPAGGDLGGNYPNPVLAQITGAVELADGFWVLTDTSGRGKLYIHASGTTYLKGTGVEIRNSADQSVVTFRDDRVAEFAISALIRPWATVLPTVSDGMEVDVVLDSANDIVTTFKYRATNGKWVCKGLNAGIESRATAGESTSSDVNVDLATVGPQVVVPYSGDYMVQWGAWGYSDVDGVLSYAALVNKSTGTQLDEIPYRSAQNVYSERRARVNGIAAGQTLAVQYRTGTGQVGTFGQRIMHVEPLRVS